MDIEDAKDNLAKLFFECARYERNSMDWKEALDTFCENLITEEREFAAKYVEQYGRIKGLRDACKAMADGIRIGMRSNARHEGREPIGEASRSME